MVSGLGDGRRHAGLRDQRRRVLGSAGAGRRPARITVVELRTPLTCVGRAWLTRRAWRRARLGRGRRDRMRRAPVSVASCGSPRTVRRRSAHPLEVLARLQPRPATWSNLTWWARRKGITLLGTGDFTHPAWFDHLRETPGTGRAGPVPAARRTGARGRRSGCRRLAAARRPVRFMLSVEISTIYKRDDRTRKVHHLIYLPDFDVGRRGSTPRSAGSATSAPTAGRSSAWTPATCWRSRSRPARTATWCRRTSGRRGSPRSARSPASTRSRDCYADLADHIFAVETGLSVRPGDELAGVRAWTATGWCSNSDAHSPPALAREATVLRRPSWTTTRCGEACDRRRAARARSSSSPRRASTTPTATARAACNWEPAQTRAARRPLPGVRQAAHRRRAAPGRGAGRPARRATRPTARPTSPHLIQLHEVLGEINRRRPRSQDRRGAARRRWSPRSARSWRSCATCRSTTSPRPAASCSARRSAGCARREVRRIPGYDGEYGVIRLFEPDGAAQRPRPADAVRRPGAVPQQRKRRAGAGRAQRPRPRRRPRRRAGAAARRRAASPHEPLEPMLAGMEEVGTGLLDRLDAMQRVAASAPGGPLLIVAGPGTGKTRTLTHRIAYLCAELGVYPEQCLAITFTRRAAEELRHRLDDLLGRPVARPTSPWPRSTRSGLSILREHAPAFGLSPDFRIAEEADRIAALLESGAASAEREARRQLTAGVPAEFRDAYRKALRARDLVDLDELITLPVALLADDRRTWSTSTARGGRGSSSTSTRTSTPAQYELLRLLVPAGRQPVRDRRPRPGDLLVPRRRRRLLPAVHRGLHRRPPGAADPQLPVGARRSWPRRCRRSRRRRWCRGGGWTRPGSTRRRRRSACTPAASAEAEAEFVVADDRRAGRRRRRTARSTRGRVDAAADARAVVRRHRRAVPHRRAGRARWSTR